MDTTRQYGRDDVKYDMWYTDWMKQLARTKTRSEIETLLYGTRKDAQKASASHLAAITATHSMQSNSQRRAQSRNVVAAVGEHRLALSGALEIYDLFPEHTLEQNC